MYIIGLTGSMGSGKSTTAAVLQRLGIPVHSADDAVHDLLKTQPLIQEIGQRWHDVVVEGRIDRKALAKHVFANAEHVSWLEKKIHPRVKALRKAFLIRAARQRRRCVALDVPLLFEKKMERQCDTVLVVSTSPLLQQKRLLQRGGMTPLLMRQILSYQLPQDQKRKRATHVLRSGLQQGHLFRQVKAVVRLISSQNGTKWPPRGKGPSGK